MLSRELEVTLNSAFKEARSNRHELMSVEHLLLALLDNAAAASVLKACNAQVEKLRQELTTFIDETTPIIPDDQKYPRAHGFKAGTDKGESFITVIYGESLEMTTGDVNRVLTAGLG